MKAQEFAELDRLFNEAIELGADGTAHVMANTDPGPLRDRLLRMLSADLEQVDAVVDAAIAPPSPIGQRIGNFEIVRELGRGGMGSVYLGSRVDGDFEQQVAIKVQRGGWAQSGLNSRIFLRERQLLAQLQHPNIAHLIDGGTTEAGEPYVVMEYVEGEALGDFCAGRSVDLTARLALFISVCDAVQHAHQRLIVHRDLKPGNILVNRRGEPKLLDFGIAKLLHGPGADGDAPETVSSMMTPQYASPEQIQGKSITTASDIYSLGVILYELVCGKRPFEFDGLSPLEIERLVTTRRPVNPSGIMPIEERLAGSTEDLDLVVLKALHAEPDQRYDSAAALAADINCVLQSRPIKARPDTLAYRMRKLILRHPMASTMALGLVVVLIASTVTLSWQSIRLAQQRDLAQQEAKAAAAVSDFMVGLFQVSDPLESRQQEVTARELLRRGAERIVGDLADAPETQARLLQITAQSYANLGDYEAGLPLLESSVAIRRTLGPDARNDLAESLNRLGNYQRDAGDLQSARELIRESVEIREQLAAGTNNADLADSYNNYGLLLYDMALYDDATRFLEKSLVMHRAISGNGHMYVGIALHNLALVAQATGRYAQAELLADEALEVKRSIESEAHPSYANTLELKGGILRRRGDFDAALETTLKARKNKLANYPPDHPRVATNYRNEALIYWDQGDLERAWVTLETALNKLKANPAGRQTYLYRMTRLLGELAADRRDFDTAREKLRSAASQAERIYGDAHPAFGHAQSALAHMHLSLGQFERAAALANTAIEIYEPRLPPNSFRLLSAKIMLHRAHASAGILGASDCDVIGGLVEQARPHVVSRQVGLLLGHHAHCLAVTKPADAGAAAQLAIDQLLESLPPSNPEVIALMAILRSPEESRI